MRWWGGGCWRGPMYWITSNSSRQDTSSLDHLKQEENYLSVTNNEKTDPNNNPLLEHEHMLLFFQSCSHVKVLLTGTFTIRIFKHGKQNYFCKSHFATIRGWRCIFHSLLHGCQQRLPKCLHKVILNKTTNTFQFDLYGAIWLDNHVECHSYIDLYLT